MQRACLLVAAFTALTVAGFPHAQRPSAAAADAVLRADITATHVAAKSKPKQPKPKPPPLPDVGKPPPPPPGGPVPIPYPNTTK